MLRPPALLPHAALAAALLALPACSHTVDERAARERDPDQAFEIEVRRAWSLYGEHLYGDAERRFRAALFLARDFPPDDSRLLSARMALALVHVAQQRFDEAEAELTAVLPAQRRASGEASEPVAEVLNSLGVVYLGQQRYDDAASALLTAGRIRTALFGRRAPETAITLQNFARALHGLGRYSEAQAAYEEAYDSYRAAGPEWDARSATLQNNLGLLYRSLGMPRKAEVHHIAAIDITRRINATRNPNLAIYSRDLARLYVSQERWPEAEQRFRAALRMFQKTLGESSPQARETLLDYAAMLAKMGRPREAARLRERAEQMGSDS